MVHRYGHSLGSTLLQGLTMTINAPATLLHIPLKVPEPVPISALAGQYIYDDPSINGVVPGTLAELYFNFGVIGVFCGFFLIGRVAKYCISATHSAKDSGTLLLSFYSGDALRFNDTDDHVHYFVRDGYSWPAGPCLLCR